MDLTKEFPVKVYNTYTKQKETFKPEKPPLVGMYVCGPTVYGEPHLGHARAAISFDVVYRYLSYLGYKVRYVRNITDVGHLEDEVAGEGEDKIAKKAKLEKLEPMEIVQKYTNKYHHIYDRMNVSPPSIEPTATGHIIEQINIIQKIEANGLAYEVNGSVYFDMQKYLENYPYGELSGKIVEDLISHSRELEGQQEKRYPLDFALWKKAKPEHIMRWPSPWGEGFPGWHLECTAMSSKYLGIPFDIHGGGLDLQFPHHEGEIAQSYGAFGSHPVNYWMHNNMLTINGKKMSKSLGNFINLEEVFSGNNTILARPFSPMVVRYFILQSHYGSIIDFSYEALVSAEKGFKRLMTALQNLQQLEHPQEESAGDQELDQEVQNICKACYDNMSDDFNTAKTLASLFELGSKINAMHDGKMAVNTLSKATFKQMASTYQNFIAEVLGLRDEEENTRNNKLDSVLNMLIDMRKEARQRKNFQLADHIRDELKKCNIQLKDDKNGETTYTFIH